MYNNFLKQLQNHYRGSRKLEKKINEFTKFNLTRNRSLCREVSVAIIDGCHGDFDVIMVAHNGSPIKFVTLSGTSYVTVDSLWKGNGKRAGEEMRKGKIPALAERKMPGTAISISQQLCGPHHLRPKEKRNYRFCIFRFIPPLNRRRVLDLVLSWHTFLPNTNLGKKKIFPTTLFTIGSKTLSIQQLLHVRNIY